MGTRGIIGKWSEEEQQVIWYDKQDGYRMTHGLVMDEIPPTESYATNERKVFTSRSKLLQHYDEEGFVCTGGDHLTGKGLADAKPPKANREEINDSVREAIRLNNYGMAPMTEKERHEWLKRKT